MIQVFSQQWFDYHQRKLVWLANNPATKRWFRHALRITEHDLPLSENINYIGPNRFTYGAKKLKNGKYQVTTDFRTHNKFAKRLYYEYNTLWKLFHEFDMRIANHFVTAANLGFDTLTQYSDSTIADHRLLQDYGAGTGASWATITGLATCTSCTVSNIGNIYIRANTITDEWRLLCRGIRGFDTSSLGSSANITSATYSVYLLNKSDGLSVTPDMALVGATPGAAPPTTADFDQLGSTEFASRLAYSSATTSAYNDFTLNASGVANISLTGDSIFGEINGNYDLDAVAPTWSSDATSYMWFQNVNGAGTTQDPKLVITYAVGDIFFWHDF